MTPRGMKSDFQDDEHYTYSSLGPKINQNQDVRIVFRTVTTTPFNIYERGPSFHSRWETERVRKVPSITL